MEKCKHSMRAPKGYGCRCKKTGMIRRCIYDCPSFEPTLWTRIKRRFY